jgi:hypothetical protein
VLTVDGAQPERTLGAALEDGTIVVHVGIVPVGLCGPCRRSDHAVASSAPFESGLLRSRPDARATNLSPIDAAIRSVSRPSA